MWYCRGNNFYDKIELKLISLLGFCLFNWMYLWYCYANICSFYIMFVASALQLNELIYDGKESLFSGWFLYSIFAMHIRVEFYYWFYINSMLYYSIFMAEMQFASKLQWSHKMFFSKYILNQLLKLVVIAVWFYIQIHTVNVL